MSNSSGIPVSAALKEQFGQVVSDSSARFLQAQITNEEIVPVKTACYIIYRKEEGEWVLFCYVPDRCKVKDKMLYASTLSNLKNQLGNNYFSDQVHGTVPEDFSAKGYKHHTVSKKTEAPLTEREMLKKAEQESGEIYTGGASTYVHGVNFPVESTAMEALKGFQEGKHTYVQIAIDCDKERIILDHTSNTDFSSLSNEIPTHEPRFHFFNYRHQHEGAQVNSHVFIFSCPDGSKGTKSAPIRMRMLYSSSKANVSNILTGVDGKIDTKFEINSPEDLNEEELVAQLHPVTEVKKAAFSKPTGPGKGTRKLIR
ncbi:hypothetical protein PROFUN_08544 [Planoprotostelium fungivorum]|uniref:ADF-H domain-containing protein n=1 Tax=Planoprotostelium fungivorum TaxID=1890364 RepID=A0A2P6N1S0_9EUKA|nr:hypothetical protein PROFUN_08544 [Planoprotostelium fungivorum]